MLTEDRYVEFSAAWSPPPWSSSWNGTPWGERRDWGHTAVNGKAVSDVAGGTKRKIYVIDGGVAYHADLASVSERVNVACGSVDLGTECSNLSVGSGGHKGYYAKVGCNAHATHVAGIIGATQNNGQGRMGIYAGANIVSIALLRSPGTINGASMGPWVPCGSGDPILSEIGAAFDFVYERNSYQQAFGIRPNIVTMSINSGGIGFNLNGTPQTNRAKLEKMVAPSSVWRYTIHGWMQIFYPGAFFVQSAGNQDKDSCSLSAFGNPNAPSTLSSAAYKTSATAISTNPSDGIMVVGAIKSNGLIAKPFAVSEPSGLVDSGLGTNFGSCIDIWAPGDAIYSTWGDGPDRTNYYAPALGSITYSGGEPSDFAPWMSWNHIPPSPITSMSLFAGWARISGTSMAAPHVAAAAAYMADKFNLTTPGAIETAVRENGKQNQSRLLVYLPD